MRNLAIVAVIGFAAGILGSYSYHLVNPIPEANPIQTNTTGVQSAKAHHLAKYEPGTSRPIPLPEDFVKASALSTQSVVYIKTYSEQSLGRRSWLDLFFDLEGRLEQRVSSGSGVIFSNDGYINISTNFSAHFFNGFV